MNSNCRPPSHQQNLSIFYFSPVLTKCTLLEMCIVWFLSLPILSIHTSYFLSNIIIGSSYGTIYGSLLKNLWINILKCAKAIPEVHAALYSLSALDWATGPGTCVPWSIGKPYKSMIYAPILLPVSVKYFQLESEKAINWFSVLILSFINRSDTGASFISE